MKDIEEFAQRRDAIVKRLEIALKKYAIPENPPGAIPIFRVLPSVARELAMIWAVSQRIEADKQVIAKTVKIKKLATELLEPCNPLAAAGVSADMVRALIGVATAEVYSERGTPKPGRKENVAALQVAAKFREFYPMLAGRRVGSNADHDFVRTLEDIFEILGFKVNPQHYAKRVTKIDTVLA